MHSILEKVNCLETTQPNYFVFSVAKAQMIIATTTKNSFDVDLCSDINEKIPSKLDMRIVTTELLSMFVYHCCY